MGGRTAGTRPKGSGMPAGGAGYGGAKKGPGKQGATAGGGRPKGVKTGEGKKATFRAALAPHTEELAKKWLAIAKQDGHPHQHTMLIKAAELAGEMKQSVELTGKDGGPVEVEQTRATLAERLARLAAAGGASGLPRKRD